MALKIWLSLVNDIKNIGASDTTITLASGNSLVSSGGKIGNGALKLTARQLLSSTALYGSKQISWAFWVKVNTAWETNWLDSIYWVTSDGSTTDSNRSEFYTNCTKVGMWYKGGSISGKDYVPGEWTHLAGTVDYETGKAAFYINGVVQGTTTNADKTRYVTSVYIGDSGIDICENDVRIYDHILSPAEVKEISRGLVLHYKLNQNFGLTDIILNQNTYGVYNNYAGSGTTGSITNLSETYQGCPVRRETMTPNDTSINDFKTNLYSHGVMGHNQTFLANTKYVFWIYYRPVSHTDIRVGGTASNIGGWNAIPSVPVGGGWYRVGQYRSGSVTTDKKDNIFTSFYTPTAVSGSPITIDWAAPHLLSGTIEIPEYDFFMEDKVVDSSGYGHNGEIISELHISNDTARYNGSTSFDGVDDCIVVPYNTVCPENIFTINLWFKKDAFGTKSYETLFGGPSGFEMDTRAGAATSLSLYMTSTRSGNRNSVTSLSLGNWYMVTMTRDGTKEKYYINGIFQSEIDAKAMPTGVYYIGAWASSTKQNYYGNISDFRIYCTPLLDTDIKQLYNVGMKVDNLGGVHGYELEESGNNRITKTGILEGNLMGESEFSHYLKYDSNIYIEPDGSAWVKIYHHNNPKGGSFSSTNDFINGVYIDENRWFNVNVCNYIDKWELMVKGKYTAEDNEWKIRWIQDVNPMTATFAEVAVANITKITNSGGELYGSSPSAWGGLYAKKGSAYLTANNGTNGNWWGAVGSYSVYQNGIPGWGTSGTITTTGFNDLYVRIDNVDFNIVNASNTKNKVWNASTFIEM